MKNRIDARPLLPLVVGGVAIGAAAAAYARVLRPWSLQWGAEEQEIQRVLPGDELVSNPRTGYTRAVTIHAPIEQVWQWVIQIGENRGGLYTHEWLESLFGGHGYNAERILPEFQDIQVGDYVFLYANGPGFAAAIIEPPHTFVLQTINNGTAEFTKSVAHDGIHGSVAFILEPRPDHQTRLIMRSRLDYEPTRFYETMWGMVEPVDFVLGRKTLLGIKERAERHGVADEMPAEIVEEEIV